MTLTRLCKALGWPRLRRWSQAIERVKAAEAAGAPPAADRYDLAVKWDADSVSIGQDRRGTQWLWVEGQARVLRRPRVYIAPKRGGNYNYHLVFLPHDGQAGVPVVVNGVALGTSKISYAPGSEWNLEDGLVTQVRVELAPDSPWIAALAADLGISLERAR